MKSSIFYEIFLKVEKFEKHSIQDFDSDSEIEESNSDGFSEIKDENEIINFNRNLNKLGVPEDMEWHCLDFSENTKTIEKIAKKFYNSEI